MIYISTILNYLLLMISFIQDIFHKVMCNVPSYITQKLSNIHNFLFPTSLQYNSALPEEKNNIKNNLSGIDNTNIFNQQNNPRYALNYQDMAPIIQNSSPIPDIISIIISDLKDFNSSIINLQNKSDSNNIALCSVENQQKQQNLKNGLTKTLQNTLNSFLNSLCAQANEKVSVVMKNFIVNINNNHWTCLSMVKKGDNLYVLYKDSATIEPTTKEHLPKYIQNIADQLSLGEKTSVQFIANSSAEQQDNTSCGIFALKNLETIQQELSGENPEVFLENFADYQGFTKHGNIADLRKKYAKEYLHSQIKSILLKENNKITITKNYLKQELQEDLNIAGNSDLAQQINTYVDSYNPNAQLEEAFSNPLYSSVWLLNKTYPAKTYAFQENHAFPALTGAEDPE